MEEEVKKENKSGIDQEVWKMARWGIYIFCLLHLVFELLTGNEKRLVIPVLANYFISSSFIKSRLAKGKTYENPLLTGLYVSGTIFLIRVVLFLIFFLFLTV